MPVIPYIVQEILNIGQRQQFFLNTFRYYYVDT